MVAVGHVVAKQLLGRWLVVLAVLALAAAAVVTGAPRAQAAGTCNVTSGADSGAGTFRQAILDANLVAGCDIINFTAGIRVSMSGTRIAYTAAHPLTINGNDATIDGTGGSTGILNLNASATGGVTINNLTFQNGRNTSTQGGAIQAQYPVGSGSLTLNDTLFANNTCVSPCTDGGAVDFISNLIVNNSTFRGNSAAGDGGAIDDSCQTPATCIPASVNFSTFANNVAGDEGGAMSAGFSFGMTNVTITGNRAKYGGALSNRNLPTILGTKLITLRYVTITKNSATKAGGNIYGQSLDAGGSIIAQPTSVLRR